MLFQKLHAHVIMPTLNTAGAAGYDIYMPESGEATGESKLIGLGFKAAVPSGFVALLLPRSSTGAKHGLELNNSVGVIDSDYRGEWKAAMRTKTGIPLTWAMHDRMLQFVLVPCATPALVEVDQLPDTDRSTEGFGSTGR